MRWDLIEKFEVLRKNEYAKAHKKFSGKEDFFLEHFTDDALVPQTLLIEMVAQAGGVLFGFGLDFKKEVILAKIRSARFEHVVRPPCALIIEARIDEAREEGAWISGTVQHKDQCVAEVSLLLVTVDTLLDNQTKIVFNDDFIEHFDIYNVAKASEGKR